jgi:ribosomal protein S18 acetylase RimI-like enzyme
VVNQFESEEENRWMVPQEKVGPSSAIPKEVIEIKVFSGKALRRIRDAAGPGSGKDGDGDGLTDDGTRFERPATPQILSSEISELWSKAHEEALARRTLVAKSKISVLRRRPPEKNPQETYVDRIQEALDTGDNYTAEEIAEQIFNHSALGKIGEYRSRVEDSGIEELDGQPVLRVAGSIFESRDEQSVAGGFSRYITTSANDELTTSGPGAYHDELKINPEYRSQGIARDFLLSSEIQYSLAGIKEISLYAALDSGPFIWARDNYDWIDQRSRSDYLSGLLRVVNDMVSRQELNREIANEYRQLIGLAMNESFDNPDRLMPIHFAYMPEYAKIFETSKSKDRFGNSSLWWKGRRPVRPYRNMMLGGGQ